MSFNSEHRDRAVPAPAPTPGLRPLFLTVIASSLLAGCGYSRIHELDEQAGEARSDIEVQLLRRAELVPRLVETVQRYVEAEPTAFEAAADARVELVAAVRSGDLPAMERASTALSGPLIQLLALAAERPDLQADPGFQRQRSQLQDTEQRIDQAGRSYNEAARRFNDYIAGFPQVVTAKLVGAQPRQPFEAFETPDPASHADQ